MSQDRKPDSAAITVRRDRASRVLYSTTNESARAAGRFESFQQALLVESTLSPGARVAARLIAFELILNRDELDKILRALPGGVYRSCADTLLLEWQWGNDWLDRRSVSALTGRALEEFDGAATAVAPWPEIAHMIARVIPAWDDLGEAASIARLLHAGRAWAVLNLPGFLAAHVCRDAPLCALPRSTLARGATGLAWVDPESGSQRRTDPRRLGALLDTVESGISVSGDHMALVTQLKTAIRDGVKAGGTHHEMRGAMLDSIKLRCGIVARDDQFMAEFRIEAVPQALLPLDDLSAKPVPSAITQEIHSLADRMETDLQAIYTSVETGSAGQLSSRQSNLLHEFSGTAIHLELPTGPLLDQRFPDEPAPIDESPRIFSAQVNVHYKDSVLISGLREEAATGAAHVRVHGTQQTLILSCGEKEATDAFHRKIAEIFIAGDSRRVRFLGRALVSIGDGKIRQILFERLEPDN